MRQRLGLEPMPAYAMMMAVLGAPQASGTDADDLLPIPGGPLPTMVTDEKVVQKIMAPEGFAAGVSGFPYVTIVRLPRVLWGAPVPAYRIAVIGVGLAVALGLTLWLRFSRLGLFVRAASTDPTTTAMQGVNTDALSAMVVGVGTALAGLAGVVAAPFLSLSPSMGSDVLIDSFVVVVIGGLGSLAGAFIAAMLLGQVQALGAVWMSGTSVLLPFAIMVAILLLRRLIR